MATPAILMSLILLGQNGLEATPKSLDIYFIDVNGGAATLLVTPERESVLIDSGWPGFDDRDPKRIEHVLKDVAKLDHLDHLVTTHWHIDHYGGVEGLAKRVRVDHFWDRGLPDPAAPDGDRLRFPDGPTPNDPLGVSYRRVTEGKRRALKPGDSLPVKGVELIVLAAGGEVMPRPEGPLNVLCGDAPPDHEPDRSDNARSLVLRFRRGKFDFLDCGDLTWNVEKTLVCPVNRIGPIDLFQVTHHGMAISNHPTLLQTIRPTVAIMDNGPRKGGDAATVERLRKLPGLEALYQLHKNAATTPAENTNPALIANTDPKGGEFLKVSVDLDGSSFTIRKGSDGPERKFLSH